MCIRDSLRNINFLHTLVNSHTLQLETIRSVIKQIRKTFLKLHTLFGLNESLKLHVIFAHYVEYFEKTGHTLLRYSDEVTEAVHSQLRMFEERHKLKRNNKSSQGQADAQHTCVVFYNSVALGDISTKELVPFTQLVKVRRGQLVLALPNIRFS